MKVGGRRSKGLRAAVSVGVPLLCLLGLVAARVNKTLSLDHLCPEPPRLLSHFRFLDEKPILQRLEDCASYRLQHPSSRPVLSSARPPPVAYSILVHKDVVQLERLLRFALVKALSGKSRIARHLYDGINDVCVSVDAKSLGLRAKVEKLAACLPGLRIANASRDVFWGGVGVLKAHLDCARTQLSSSENWRHWIPLSAQDVPLLPQDIVRKGLASSGSKSHVQMLPEKRRRMFERSQKLVLRRGHAVDQRPSYIRKSPPPGGIRLLKGNLAVAIHRNTLRWMLHDTKVERFLAWLSDTSVPDEHFFPTVLGNPKYFQPPQGVGLLSGSYDIRWVKWTSEDGAVCEGKVIRGVCLLGLRDLKRLLVSRPNFYFANKLYLGYQPEAYECLESYLEAAALGTI